MSPSSCQEGNAERECSFRVNMSHQKYLVDFCFQFFFKADNTIRIQSLVRNLETEDTVFLKEFLCPFTSLQTFNVSSA